MDDRRRRHLLARYEELAAGFEEISRRRSGRPALRAAPPLPEPAGVLSEPFDVDRTLGLDQGLSPREIDVLGLVAAGATNKQIAATLRVSNETVKSHIRKLLTTLRSSSRAHAVSVGFCRGILRPSDTRLGRQLDRATSTARSSHAPECVGSRRLH